MSLPQIARAAGQSNPNAVQYHFGSKEGLIEAIFILRLPSIDRERQELLTKQSEQNLADIRGLLEALFLPLLSVRGEDGRHSYAASLRNFLTNFSMPDFWHRIAESATTTMIVRCLLEMLEDFPPEVRGVRLVLASALILEAFSRLIEFNRSGSRDIGTELLISTALDMGAAALLCEAREGDWNSLEPIS